jgi:hypothetical protein
VTGSSLHDIAISTLLIPHNFDNDSDACESLADLDGSDDALQDPIPSQIGTHNQELTDKELRLTSWIWNHGIREEGIYWRCNLCKDKVKRYVTTGTTHPAGHLRGFHGLRNEDQGKSVRAKAIGGLAPIFTPVRPFVCEEYKQRLVEWILLDRIPFRQIETNTFRNMIETANPTAVNTT